MCALLRRFVWRVTTAYFGSFAADGDALNNLLVYFGSATGALLLLTTFALFLPRCCPLWGLASSSGLCDCCAQLRFAQDQSAGVCDVHQVRSARRN
jgi:hypothetical protein